MVKFCKPSRAQGNGEGEEDMTEEKATAEVVVEEEEEEEEAVEVERKEAVVDEFEWSGAEVVVRRDKGV